VRRLRPVLNPLQAAFADNSGLLNGKPESDLRVTYANEAGALTKDVWDDIRDLLRTSNQGELVETGWTKLANGLIIQWGIGPIQPRGQNELKEFYFPTPFPNKIFTVALTTEIVEFPGNSTAGDLMYQLYSWNKRYFIANMQIMDPNIGDFHYRCHFIAMGH
jgi:hypothetical protein